LGQISLIAHLVLSAH